MALAFDPARLDWNLLRAFGAVMACGSLTQAAARLGSSQPTLSRQVAQLEAALGTPLFERAARRLLPTAAAQALAEPAQRMLAAAQACADAAEASRDSLAGSVRLTASEVVACHVLPPMLAELAARHPQVQIELVASDRLDNLLEHEADIAVRMVRPTQASLISRHLADWPLGLYLHRRLLPAGDAQVDTRPQGSARPPAGARPHASARARAGAPDPTDPPDPPDLANPADAAAWLARQRKVGFDQSTLMIEGYRQAGHALRREDFDFRCDHQLVNLAAVRAGLGLGVVLVPLAEQMPELVRVLPAQPLPSLPVWLTAHRALRGSRRMRVVFDHLAQALGRWGQPAS